MTDAQMLKVRDRIVEAMKISSHRLWEQKKRLGQTLIISENGVIKEIDPNKVPFPGEEPA